MRSAFAVAALFARDANLTFGGGLATAETLRRELVTRRAWLSDEEFRFSFAAAQLTPGTNLLALCTALGWRLRGGLGAVIALLAASIPTACLVAVLMAAYGNVMAVPAVDRAARGAVAASVALILSNAWALVRPEFAPGKRMRTLTLLLACWAGYDVFAFSPLTVLLGAGLVGSLWAE